MKIQITDNVYRVQVLMGSEVVQLWYPAYPFMREYSIRDVDMVDLRAQLDSEEWEVRANNSVTTYNRKVQNNG